MKECIEIVIDLADANSQLSEAGVIMDYLPINLSNRTLMMRKIEAVLDSYNISSTSDTLVFESIDLVKDTERFEREIRVINFLLKY